MQPNTRETGLDRANTDLNVANTRLKKAQQELELAQETQKIAAARYRREALWLRLDELKREQEKINDELYDLGGWLS